MIHNVQGKCPACGCHTLFIASGGYITCSRYTCPNPTALADILDDVRTDHVVVIGEKSFTVRHPLIERVGNALEECPLHDSLSKRVGPPPLPGVYAVTHITPDESGLETWRQISLKEAHRG